MDGTRYLASLAGEGSREEEGENVDDWRPAVPLIWWFGRIRKSTMFSPCRMNAKCQMKMFIRSLTA